MNTKKLNNSNNIIEEANDYCDLDNTKICDNCCKCIESNVNYKVIKITDIIVDDDKK